MKHLHFASTVDINGKHAVVRRAICARLHGAQSLELTLVARTALSQAPAWEQAGEDIALQCAIPHFHLLLCPELEEMLCKRKLQQVLPFAGPQTGPHGKLPTAFTSMHLNQEKWSAAGVSR